MSANPRSSRAWADIYQHWHNDFGSRPVLARELVESLGRYRGVLPIAISRILYSREDRRGWAMRLGRCLGPMVDLEFSDSAYWIERRPPRSRTGPTLWIIKFDSFDDHANKTGGGLLPFCIRFFRARG